MNVQGAIKLGLRKLGFKPIKENYPLILVMYLDDEPFLLESIQCLLCCTMNKTFCNLDILLTVTRGEIDKPVNQFSRQVYNNIRIPASETRSPSPLTFLYARFLNTIKPAFN